METPNAFQKGPTYHVYTSELHLITPPQMYEYTHWRSWLLRVATCGPRGTGDNSTGRVLRERRVVSDELGERFDRAHYRVHRGTQVRARWVEVRDHAAQVREESAAHEQLHEAVQLSGRVPNYTCIFVRY